MNFSYKQAFYLCLYILNYEHLKALNDNHDGLIMPEILDMQFVESAKNGMLFLPLESEKLKKVYPRLYGWQIFIKNSFLNF